MAYPIKFLSLQKAELEYEVAVRGGTTENESVQDLRKQIVKLVATLPSEDILESHLEPNEDLTQIKETQNKIKLNLDSLKTKFDKNVCLRTETIIHHVYFRMLRVNQVGMSTAVKAIYSECAALFKRHYDDLKHLKKLNPESSTPISITDPLSDVISVTCEKKIISEVINKLKYSGKTCVRSFIQRAEELAQSRKIPKEQLLTFAFEIFTDDALHWYRCIKDKVESWDDLVEHLKQDFSQSDYDYRLLSEIRMRTQGEHENISIYLSIMHGLFSRLSKNLPEEDKLDILLHNIRPSYASTLAASPNISTIEELKKMCRSYENIQSRMAQFHEPPKVNSETLAKEFAYNKPSTSTPFNKHNNYNTYAKYDYNKNRNYKTNQNNYTNNNTEQHKNIHVNAVSSPDNTTLRKIYCPRCRNDSHSLTQCNQPHFLICFKCGKKGVRYPDCSVCNSVPITKN